MPTARFTVNGQPVSVEVENRRLLVEVLRDELALTGTHIGCDTSQCGCCTVLIDGRPAKACATLAVAVEGRASLHPRAHWLQIGVRLGLPLSVRKTTPWPERAFDWSAMRFEWIRFLRSQPGQVKQ